MPGGVLLDFDGMRHGELLPIVITHCILIGAFQKGSAPEWALHAQSSWITQLQGKLSLSQCTSMGSGIVSQVVNTSEFCNKGQHPQIIEPLAGILQDPRMFRDEDQKYLLSIDWLLFSDSSVLKDGGRKIFFVQVALTSQTP